MNTPVMRYLDRLNELEHERSVTYNSSPDLIDRFELEEGRKYLKVIKVGKWQRSVHSFINKATGDLYKPAGWKAPVLDSRGNLYTDIDEVLKRADLYGSYLYKNR